MATVLPFVGEVSPYWVGVIGSVCVELGSALRGCSQEGGRLPDIYKSVPYWVIRTLMAFAAGFLPVFLDAANSMNAFMLGVSAPLVLDKLERGVHPTVAIRSEAPASDQATN